jgi:hypothetical protein
MLLKKNWCSLASLFSSFVIPFLAPLLCYSFLCCSLFHYFALLFLDSMFPFFTPALLCYILTLLLLALLHHCFATPLFHCALASLHPMAKMQIGADVNEIKHQWNQTFG